MQLVLASVGCVAPGAVHRDANDLGLVVLKFGQDLVVERHLVAAHRAPVGGVKSEHDRAASQFTQRKRLVRGYVKVEIRGFNTATQYCHAFPPWWNVSRYDSRRSVRGIWIRPPTPKKPKKLRVYFLLFL